MDPNKTLETLLALANKVIQDYNNPESNGIDQEEANELAQSILDLNSWIQMSSFLPKKWNDKNNNS